MCVQGWEIMHCEELEKEWKEKFAEWDGHAKGENSPYRQDPPYSRNIYRKPEKRWGKKKKKI